MDKLNDIHIDIANVLIDCASKQQTISYSCLCEKVGFSNPRQMGAVLDPLTKLTYDAYGIFISALVVLSESTNDELPMPGDGFFAMYNEKMPKSILSKEEIVKAQRGQAFNQNWSKLPELIREKIREQN